MASGPRLSVVIDNYNYDSYLRDAIESALQQTTAAYEIIVVDDGSTDNSRQIIQEFGSRIRPIFQSNAGQGAALAAGIAASTGDVVCFLDADDRWYPHKLKTISDVIARLPHNWSYLRHNLDVLVEDASHDIVQVVPGIRESVAVERISTDDIIQSRRNAPTSAICAPTSFLRALLRTTPIMPFTISADAFLYTHLPLKGWCASLGASLGQYRVHTRNHYFGRHSDTARKRALDVEMCLLRTLPRHVRYSDSILNLAHSLRKTHPEYLSELGHDSYRIRRVIGQVRPLTSLARRAVAAIKEVRRIASGAIQ